MRFVILVLDGLRPDLVEDGTMPNLITLRREGTQFTNARSTFPSETRVATSSLITGCRPGAHGLVANTMFVPSIARSHVLRTNRIQDLALLGQGGSPLLRPTLGEVLAAAGRSLAVVSAGTPGSAMLTHPLADRLGAFRWNVNDTDGATAERVRSALGPTPAPAVPNRPRIAFAADVMTHLVLPELRPDIALLWCSEPDISFHAHGVGAAEDALRAADAVVGQVRLWRDAQPDAAEIGLLVLSDHGHVTGSRRIEIAAELQAAGFPVSPGFKTGFKTGFDTGELVVTGGAAPGLYLADDALLPALTAFLAAQDWAGPLLSAEHLAQIGSANERSPTRVMLFRGSEQPDALGIPGTAPYDAAEIPLGGGMHGGLHQRELATVMVMHGGPFALANTLDSYADLSDVAPTLLHLIDVPNEMDGRVLTEAWDPLSAPVPLRDDLALPGGFTLDAVRQDGRFYPIGLRPRNSPA